MYQWCTCCNSPFHPPLYSISILLPILLPLLPLADMGNGQVDDSLQIMVAQQPALNTTNLIYNQIDQTDLVLHIGDISYARGYASVVSGPCVWSIELGYSRCGCASSVVTNSGVRLLKWVGVLRGYKSLVHSS